jgi:hypothetical protein
MQSETAAKARRGSNGKPRTRPVTLADVSKDAGVSIMTVSNVVRGRHDLLRPETRRRVEEAIARLSYRPNLSARSLRLSEQRSVEQREKGLRSEFAKEGNASSARLSWFLQRASTMCSGPFKKP